MTQSEIEDAFHFDQSAELRRLRRDHPHGLKPPQLAKLIGVSAATITRRFKQGLLPHIDHGSGMRFVQWPVVHLVVKYGLRAVGVMVQAGRL